MKARINKETEKAINLTYGCEIYEEIRTVKNVWFPKSVFTKIEKLEDNKVEIEWKYLWMLDKKTKEYFSEFPEDMRSRDIRNYLSKINSERVEFCWA